MQSMAEHYLQQGIEQGARATTIQNILSVLNTRFPEGDAQSVEQALKSVRDLDHLAQMHLTALQISTFEDFFEVLKA